MGFQMKTVVVLSDNSIDFRVTGWLRCAYLLFHYLFDTTKIRLVLSLLAY
jgi:hypothetical protein